MTGLPDRQLFATPFAGGSGASVAPITDAGADFCFEKGFDSAFSAPHSNGGKYVTRAQMNRIGNLATKNDFYRMCGGINTFDPVFAQKIGGYPKGAILDYYTGTQLLKVVSLVENNTDDFTQSITPNPAYWKLLNQGDQELTIGAIKIGSFYGDFDVSVNALSVCTDIVIPKNGILSLRNVVYSQTTTSGSSGAFHGNAFLAKQFSSTDDIVIPNTTNYASVYPTWHYLPGMDPNGNVLAYSTAPNLKYLQVEAGKLVRILIQTPVYGVSITSADIVIL